MTETGSLPEGISTISLRDRTWYSLHRSLPGAPHSSLTQLIQGIWENEPAQARAILRKRIHTTDPLSPMNRGMVKTAAQRVTSVMKITVDPAWHRVEFTADPALPELATGEDRLPPMELALALAGRARRRAERFLSDRPVGCVLLDSSGERIAWAFNTNRSNRTRHAEVNLLQAIWARTGTGPTIGSRLFTTLEPCRMCQGMLHDCAPGIRIYFATRDGVPPVPWQLDMSLLER